MARKITMCVLFFCLIAFFSSCTVLRIAAAIEDNKNGGPSSCYVCDGRGRCPSCNGIGRTGMQRCNYCGGTGVCSNCQGTGVVNLDR
jgi:hypothetical protein